MLPAALQDVTPGQGSPCAPPAPLSLLSNTATHWRPPPRAHTTRPPRVSPRPPTLMICMAVPRACSSFLLPAITAACFSSRVMDTMTAGGYTATRTGAGARLGAMGDGGAGSCLAGAQRPERRGGGRRCAAERPPARPRARARPTPPPARSARASSGSGAVHAPPGTSRMPPEEGSMPKASDMTPSNCKTRNRASGKACLHKSTQLPLCSAG
jgi:hypothetical protein